MEMRRVREREHRWMCGPRRVVWGLERVASLVALAMLVTTGCTTEDTSTKPAAATGATHEDGPITSSEREMVQLIRSQALLKDARLLVEGADDVLPPKDLVEVTVERAACVEWSDDASFNSSWRVSPARALWDDRGPEHDLQDGRTRTACFTVSMKNIAEKTIERGCQDRFRLVAEDGMVLRTHSVSRLHDELGQTELDPGQACRGTIGFRYRPSEHPKTVEYRGKLVHKGVRAFEIAALPASTSPNPLNIPVPAWSTTSTPTPGADVVAIPPNPEEVSP